VGCLPGGSICCLGNLVIVSALSHSAAASGGQRWAATGWLAARCTLQPPHDSALITQANPPHTRSDKDGELWPSETFRATRWLGLAPEPLNSLLAAVVAFLIHITMFYPTQVRTGERVRPSGARQAPPALAVVLRHYLPCTALPAMLPTPSIWPPCLAPLTVGPPCLPAAYLHAPLICAHARTHLPAPAALRTRGSQTPA
jgi:hypothetical protein